MNIHQPVRQVLNARSPLNMREVAALLGVSPTTAARKVAEASEELRAYKTSGARGQWRVRLGDLRRVFQLP
jgi:DNA-directed RNA polymerase specialized sigma24 family protein